ncbi:hypothetical protein QE369_001458 [Agrobacterium larrymoorei]|uniref:Uncharacterized protein n=1 Tax=Agrobacterium larrymoorei TaxID=160699 RepID=A0AAJ2B8B6_9HYPH|nr:hypothetical protein [Agrobacterium larrymoorei]MDR6101280.1 hypothetical protein [Agrobacterium larrymoorei]
MGNAIFKEYSSTLRLAVNLLEQMEVKRHA